MAYRINAVQGDNNIKIVFNIKKDNLIESILGATVELQFINLASGTKLKRVCTVTEASSAECMYVLTSEDTAEVGGYQTELTIHYANGTTITSLKPFVLVVKPQIVED